MSCPGSLTGFRKREIYGVSVQLEPSAIHNQLSQRTDDVSGSMSKAVRENVARHQVELISGTATLHPFMTFGFLDPAGGSGRVSPGGPDTAVKRSSRTAALSAS
jgi:hypothetical protein